MFPEEKMMVWKRCRRHDGTHDLDTSEHDRRESSRELESAIRWFRISSRISLGILGSCGVAVGVGRRLSFDGFEPILSRDSGIIDRLPWALFIGGRSYGRTGCREPDCTDSSEHFAVRTPPKEYVPGDRTHLINDWPGRASEYFKVAADRRLK